MSRTWQDNAAEFALMDKQEGWLFARLIACSVEKRPQGRPKSTDRYLLKASAKEFSREACGTDNPNRVLRYLAAWNKAAAAGHCAPSKDLVPSDAETTAVPPLETWSQYYDASKKAPSPSGGSGGRGGSRSSGQVADRSELNALEEYGEARKHIVDAMWQANHYVGFVISEWPDYRRLLGPDDLASVMATIEAMEEDFAVLKMLLADDIVGEVLRHEQG
jgi:hypothetical protein